MAVLMSESGYQNGGSGGMGTASLVVTNDEFIQRPGRRLFEDA
ncbi:hypothetical protein ACGLWX_07185 [Halomonas sp. HMF6819]|nr:MULTISPECIES: hypothetical protein [unclassified Halomonas]